MEQMRKYTAEEKVKKQQAIYYLNNIVKCKAYQKEYRSKMKGKKAKMVKD